MESNNPLILRAFAVGNKVLQKVGRYFTVFAASAAVGVVGTSTLFCCVHRLLPVLTFPIGIYVCLTAYGAWAVQKFIGKE